MSDMVERVAEAMVAAYNPDPDKPGSFRWNFMEGMTNMSEEQKDVWRGLARAAIGAMRDPTEGMQRAAFQAPVTFKTTDGAYLEGRLHIESSLAPDKGAASLWRAMIDAALT